MGDSSNTIQNISNVPNGLSGLTNNYSGYFLEKSISEIVMNFIKGRNNKTITGIFFAVGVLIGVDVVKTITLDLVKEQKKQISDEIIGITKCLNILAPIKYTFGLISYGFDALVYKFNKLFEKKYITIPNEQIEEYTLKSSNLFLTNLIKYITNEKNLCQFEKVEDTELIINKNKIFNNITYSNISIPYDNHIIKINSNIFIGFDGIKCDSSSNNIFETLMEKYIDLIDDSSLNNIDIIIERRLKGIKVYIDEHDTFYVENADGCKFIIENNINTIIFSLCLTKYNKTFTNIKITHNKKLIVVAWIITVAMCLLNICDKDNLKKIILTKFGIDVKSYYKNSLYYSQNLSFAKIKNGESLIYFIRDDLSKQSDFIKNQIKIYAEGTTVKTSDIKFVVKPISSIEFNKTNPIGPINTTNTTNSTNLINPISQTNTMDLIKKFISQINNLSLILENQNKIKIYVAKIKTKIIKTTNPNPKYEKYFEEKKKLLSENANCTNEKIIQLLGIEPEKELEVETVEKEVELTYTNERFTSFLNLYLSDSQDEKLKTLLNSFNNDKERLEELGIPNKLCLLLHGEPGTGKTTTIITTASYFSRDIFYLSLKNISNNDLKMIFDYVNEKHSNQGIIVLEDFDAMTNVVSKRTNNNNDNNNNQMDLTNLMENIDSELTLDFFLNVLDGTLTTNNSIVIMTTNHLENIDPAIYRAGRVDSLIEMKKSDHTQIKKMFKRFISRDIDINVLNKIEEHKWVPAKIIFRLKEFIKRTDLTDEEILSPFLNE